MVGCSSAKSGKAAGMGLGESSGKIGNVKSLKSEKSSVLYRHECPVTLWIF